MSSGPTFAELLLQGAACFRERLKRSGDSGDCEVLKRVKEGRLRDLWAPGTGSPKFCGLHIHVRELPRSWSGFRFPCKYGEGSQLPHSDCRADELLPRLLMAPLKKLFEEQEKRCELLWIALMLYDESEACPKERKWAFRTLNFLDADDELLLQLLYGSAEVFYPEVFGESKGPIYDLSDRIRAKYLADRKDPDYCLLVKGKRTHTFNVAPIMESRMISVAANNVRTHLRNMMKINEVRRAVSKFAWNGDSASWRKGRVYVTKALRFLLKPNDVSCDSDMQARLKTFRSEAAIDLGDDQLWRLANYFVWLKATHPALGAYTVRHVPNFRVTYLGGGGDGGPVLQPSGFVIASKTVPPPDLVAKAELTLTHILGPLSDYYGLRVAEERAAARSRAEELSDLIGRLDRAKERAAAQVAETLDAAFLERAAARLNSMDVEHRRTLARALETVRAAGSINSGKVRALALHALFRETDLLQSLFPREWGLIQDLNSRLTDGRSRATKKETAEIDQAVDRVLRVVDFEIRYLVKIPLGVLLEARDQLLIKVDGQLAQDFGHALDTLIAAANGGITAQVQQARKDRCIARLETLRQYRVRIPRISGAILSGGEEPEGESDALTLDMVSAMCATGAATPLDSLRRKFSDAQPDTFTREQVPVSLVKPCQNCYEQLVAALFKLPVMELARWINIAARLSEMHSDVSVEGVNGLPADRFIRPFGRHEFVLLVENLLNNAKRHGKSDTLTVNAALGNYDTCEAILLTFENDVVDETKQPGGGGGNRLIKDAITDLNNGARPLFRTDGCWAVRLWEGGCGTPREVWPEGACFEIGRPQAGRYQAVIRCPLEPLREHL